MKRLAIICLTIMFVLLASAQLLRGAGGQIIILAAIFATGIGLMLYMRWFQKFAKQVNALMPFLTEDPQRYITETEKLLEGRRPNNVRAMLTMNIAAAHMEMGDFTSAKKKLLQIHGGSLKKSNANVFFLNLTYVLVQLEENETAMEFMGKYKKRFLTLPMGGNIPHLNAFLHIFEAMEKNNWEEAETQYIDALEAWPEKVIGVDYGILERKLTAHFGRAPKITTETEEAAPILTIADESTEDESSSPS